jgi:hypothetical protein
MPRDYRKALEVRFLEETAEQMAALGVNVEAEPAS